MVQTSEVSTTTQSFYKPNMAYFNTTEFRTLLVVIAIALSQGLITTCSTIWNYVYEDNFKLTPAQSSYFATMLQLPWTLKPIWGVLSDNVPLFGYRRKSYLIVMTFVSFMCFLAFGLCELTTWVGFAVLMSLNIAQSSQSVVGQAIVVEAAQQTVANKDASSQEKEGAASKSVSIFFGTKTVGRVIYSALIMFFFQLSNMQQFLLGTSIIPLMVFVIGFILPEENAWKKKRNTMLNEEIPADIQQSLMNIEEPNENSNKQDASNFKRALQFIKDPLVYKSILLIFVVGFAPNSAQTKFDYYTTELGFSTTYMGGLNLVACLGGVAGVWVFYKFFSQTGMRKFYTVCGVICTLVVASQLLLLFRINKRFGIPDGVFVIFDTFLVDIASEINGLPVLVLSTKICPKNIEATVFAIMIAVTNVATNISGVVGAAIVQYLGIQTTDFSKLWVLIVVTAIFNLTPIILVWAIDYDKAIKQLDQRKTEEQTHIESETVRASVGSAAEAGYGY